MNVPVSLVVKVTVPVGAVAPDEDVSITVAMQVVGWFTATEEREHETLVLVLCKATGETVTSKVFELVEWRVSPA